MGAKEDILGTKKKNNVTSAAPPIDSSLEGAPTSSAAPQAQTSQQTTSTPQPTTAPPTYTAEELKSAGEKMDASGYGSNGKNNIAQSTSQPDTQTSRNDALLNKYAGEVHRGNYLVANSENETKSNPSQNNSEEYTPGKFYDEFGKYTGMQKPMSPDELAAEEKKRKRSKLFASIGDGISALSNLYFTTKDAPNMYNPRSTMSERQQARWDKIDAERRANNQIYLNAYLRAKQQHDTAANMKNYNDWRAKYYNAMAANKEGATEDNHARTDAYVSTQKSVQGWNAARQATEEGKPQVQKSEIYKNEKQGNASIIRANKTGSSRGRSAGSRGSATKDYTDIKTKDSNGNVVKTERHYGPVNVNSQKSSSQTDNKSNWREQLTSNLKKKASNSGVHAKTDPFHIFKK